MTREEFRQTRKGLGMTQQQLAHELRVVVATVARWESGTHPLPPYIDLALDALTHRRANPVPEISTQ